jgi:hypothetical protein
MRLFTVRKQPTSGKDFVIVISDSAHNLSKEFLVEDPNKRAGWVIFASTVTGRWYVMKREEFFDFYKEV